MNITEELFKLKDDEYKKFHAKLIPNIFPENIIGVRTPVLRKFARGISGSDEAAEFVKNPLGHRYYDEKNLHAFLIEPIRGFDESVSACEAFLKTIDNWATCDMYSPKAFSKNIEKLPEYIEKWISDKHTYTVRFGIGIAMKYFLDDNFSSYFAEKISGIRSDEYYVNMMIAWYFATALAKQFCETEKFISEMRLSPWIHNKAIQKAVESRRISCDKKIYLKSLKRNKI